MEYQSENKICQNCKKDFTIEMDDFSFYEKIKVPPPTFCPECRMQRRFSVRNERNLYRRECGLCGNKIISMYSPDKQFPVFCTSCWWGDKWDPTVDGQQYDFTKPFFKQFRELLNKIPRPSLIVPDTKNCDFCNHMAGGKDSYLCFGSINIENCFYGSPYESKYCVDTYVSRECEYCYESIDSEKLSRCKYCHNCSNSFDLTYCFDCKNCNDCIGCAGLRNKSYFIFNKQYTKEGYLKEKSKILDGSYKKLNAIKEEFENIKIKLPRKFSTILYSDNVKGDHIVQSKNATYCFDVKKSKDIKYCKQVIEAIDVHDANYCEFMELCYDYIGYWKINRVLFSNIIGDSNNIKYSDFCSASSNLFGCIALRSKQYCILNRQYTKSEYEELVPKIIKHMSDMPYIDSKGRVYKYGEFFPSELSPFAYNETIAQEYYPLTKEQALEQGYKWKDKEERNYTIDIHTEDIPDSINDIQDNDILNKVIECSHKGTCNQQCTEAFKIIPEELSFYRRMNLPLPRLCPNCRHYERLAQRNPMKRWHRQCMKEGCTNEFETSYAPERPEIVYCERCYQNEVY